MLTVVGLCAAWCDVCRDFRPGFERLADENPHARFIWLDIEDDAEVVGDVEVEDFPTIAMFRDGVPLHFGATLPQEAVVRRLIEALRADDPPRVCVPEAVATLPTRLAGRLA